MRDIKLLFLVIVSVICLGLLSDGINADTGSEGAVRKEQGSYASMNILTLSSFTGTTVIAASTLRPDAILFNNTGSTIWIGTVTATVSGVTHSNVIAGIPVLASATLRLDGSFTGALGGNCNAGVATCEIRVLEGLVR